MNRLVVGVPTSIGLLNHGRYPSFLRSFSGLLLVEGAIPTGVRGVVSLDEGSAVSLVVGE